MGLWNHRTGQIDKDLKGTPDPVFVGKGSYMKLPSILSKGIMKASRNGDSTKYLGKLFH